MLRRISECNGKLNAEIEELDRQIKAKYEPYREVLGRLSEIPGVQDRTCEDLIAEIGLDMSIFLTAAHLCSWAAMCPGNNESAGKKRVARPTRPTSKSRLC